MGTGKRTDRVGRQAVRSSRTLAARIALGRVRVVHTTDWRSMISEDLESITAGTVVGERLYPYPTAR
jgi:hypothetical protein